MFTAGPLGRRRSFFLADSGEIMGIWLESDAVALGTLVFGLIAIELIAFNI
jgi:hypothetical protein